MITISTTQEADKTNPVQWKIGEYLRNNPELILKEGPNRPMKILNYVSKYGKYAFVGVSLVIPRCFITKLRDLK